MKKTKALPTALILILISFSLISCQSQPLFDKNKTETADEINFEEVAGGEPLFYGMSEENFYDVTDFCVKSFNESGDSGEFNPLVQFSYVPYELRKWDGTMAYFHNNERLSFLRIDSSYVYGCLEILSNAEPIRILMPDSNQKDVVLSSFSERFGVAYSLEFMHNIKRSDHDVSIFEQQTHYDFLISPKTKNNTYYLYNKNTLTVAEVDVACLPFLENSSEDWFDRYLFEKHIGLVNKIEIGIKDGTTDGIHGVTDMILEHHTVDANGATLSPLDAVAAGPNVILQVAAHYNGETKSITDIPKYRNFYVGFLFIAVHKIVLDESRQAQLNSADPEMTIKVYFYHEDQINTLEYSFFADDSVLVNGVYVGELTKGQLDAMIRATGLMLSPDVNDIIDFW